MSIETGECCYMCSECPESFKSMDSLQTHLLSHTQKTLSTQSSLEESDAPQHSPSSSDGGSEHTINQDSLVFDGMEVDVKDEELDDLSPGYTCRFCSIPFDNQSQLNIHYTHTHRDKPQYVCEICQTIFAVKRELSTHMRLHSGEQPHKCTQCGKEFGTRQLLKKHWMWHTGERNHICPHCNKAFFQKGHLTQHLMIHSGGRPHQCKLCQKTFIFKFDLNRHMKIHAERGFSCEPCGRAFNRQSSLDEHTVKCKARSFGSPYSKTSNYSTPEGAERKPSLNSVPMLNFNQEHVAKMAQSLLAQHQKNVPLYTASTPMWNFPGLPGNLPNSRMVDFANNLGGLGNLWPMSGVQQPQPDLQTPSPSALFCVLCSKHFASQPEFTIHMYTTHINQSPSKMEENESPVKTSLSATKSDVDDTDTDVHVDADTPSNCCPNSPLKSSPFPGLSPYAMSSISSIFAPAMPEAAKEPSCDNCDEQRRNSEQLESALKEKEQELVKCKQMLKTVVMTASHLLGQCAPDNATLTNAKNIFNQLQNVV